MLTRLLIFLGALVSFALAIRDAVLRKERAENKQAAQEIEADGLKEVIKHQQKERAIKNDKPESVNDTIDRWNKL